MAQVTDGVTGAELPLAAPSAANWLLASLPPGNVSVIVYVRYADSAVTSPLGLPAGARLQVMPQLRNRSPAQLASQLLASLPPGNRSVSVYGRDADSAMTSPLGLPADALLQVQLTIG